MFPLAVLVQSVVVIHRSSSVIDIVATLTEAFSRFANLLRPLQNLVSTAVHAIRKRIATWTKPTPNPLVLGGVQDLARSKSQLIIENALLRQQLIILRQSAKRPHFTTTDRCLLVMLASKVQAWKEAVLIVKPDTVLRWHRRGFRLFWKRKSKAQSRKPKVPTETMALIQTMAINNRLWGAERIRGELLKLGIHVSKRTIQKYLQHARPPRPRGQTWATFPRNHASDIWVCDFLQVPDVFFRPIFAFFITELGSRRIVHVGVTHWPTDAWVAQQLREATPFGEAPKYLIRDNDAK